MDHGETDTTSKVIALRNARPQMYIYMFTMIAQRKFSLLFSKNVQDLSLSITSITQSDSKPKESG